MPSEFKQGDRVTFEVLAPGNKEHTTTTATYTGVIDRAAPGGYWWIIPDKLGFRMLLPEKDIKHEN